MRVLLPVLLILTACGSHYSFAAPGQDEPTLRAGLVALNAAAPCAWVQEAGGDVTVDDSNAELKSDGVGVLGYWDPLDCDIVLPEPNGYNEHERQLILIHEVGHAVGLNHEHAGIMTPYIHEMKIGDAAADLVSRAHEHHVFRCLKPASS